MVPVAEVVAVAVVVPVAVVVAQRAVQQQALESVCLQLTALDVAHRLEPAPGPRCLPSTALDSAHRLERAPSRVSLRKPYMRLVQGWQSSGAFITVVLSN